MLNIFRIFSISKDIKSHHWFKSYGQFADRLNLFYWWSRIGKGFGINGATSLVGIHQWTIKGEKQVSSAPSSYLYELGGEDLCLGQGAQVEGQLVPAHGHEGGAGLVPHLLGRWVPCRDVRVLPGAGGTGQRIVTWHKSGLSEALIGKIEVSISEWDIVFIVMILLVNGSVLFDSRPPLNGDSPWLCIGSLGAPGALPYSGRADPTQHRPIGSRVIRQNSSKYLGSIWQLCPALYSVLPLYWLREAIPRKNLLLFGHCQTALTPPRTPTRNIAEKSEIL